MNAEQQQPPIEPTDADRLENADQLGRQLVRFLRLMERAQAHFSAQTHNGVEKASYVLLARLVQEGPQRTSALAGAVHSDPSTVSRQIAALVNAGMVERRADPLDGRACLLVATPTGEQTYEEARQERNWHIDRMLLHWPTDRRRQLVELFDELNTDFENYRPQFATVTPRHRKATR